MRTQLYVDGTWGAGGAGRTAPVHDPADGSVIAEMACAEVEDCLRAVDAAARALGPWSACAPRERSEILRRAYELMRAERETIAALVTRENGKILADARAEVDYAAECVLVTAAPPAPPPTGSSCIVRWPKHSWHG